MKKYKVTITETLERVVEVEAEDYEEAVGIVEGAYRRGDIILVSDDYTGTEFEAEEQTPDKGKSENNRKDYSR